MKRTDEIEERTCKVCGVVFNPCISTQVYCSKRCQKKGNEITYEEYKYLVKEYGKTDSIKRRDEIKRIIRTASVDLCETLEKLHNKWGSEFVDDSDYQIGNGGYSLNGFDDNETFLIYSDHWRYGGECTIGIKVPMKYLDVDERLKLEEELKRKHIDSLKRAYKSNLDRLEIIKQENIEILDSLKELGANIEEDETNENREDKSAQETTPSMVSGN